MAVCDGIPQSDTPRTDDETFPGMLVGPAGNYIKPGWVDASLARQLERELAEAQRKLREYVNSEGMVRVPRKAVEGILNAKSNAEIRRIAMALLEHDISRERT